MLKEVEYLRKTNQLRKRQEKPDLKKDNIKKENYLSLSGQFSTPSSLEQHQPESAAESEDNHG